ncbi:MAG: hypothetical protein OXB88_08585 [Bacteriovoracales bacterium]|nr:hypothetical protein [Bacteriovoracales bacterium]
MGLSFFFLCSCSILMGGGQTTNLERAHIPSKANRYILSDLPEWANFSSLAPCRRSGVVKFLNFSALNRSFSYDYFSLIQLQLSFNKKYRLKKKEREGRPFPPAIEEAILFRAKSEIESGIFSFYVPEIKRVHLFWIDPAQIDPKYKKALGKALVSGRFGQGHPILISQCMTQDEMEAFIRSFVREDIDFRFISSEMFSAFDQKFNLDSRFQLFVDELLKGKKIFFYGIRNVFPNGFIRGRFQKEKTD